MSYIVAAISNGGDAPEQAYRKLKSAGTPDGRYGGVLLMILCHSYNNDKVNFLLHLFGQYFAQKCKFFSKMPHLLWCLNSL